MLFNSAIFIVLFLFIYSLYWFLPVKGKHYLIILGSLVFYGWYSIPFLMLFLALLTLNYLFSIILLTRKKKRILWTILAIDLGILGFFKYFYLLAESAGSLLGFSYIQNLQENWIRDYNFEIFLPIAISFYTFQMIAYVVDTYRGVISERVPVRKFAVFILFFPQFIAGPIMRSSDFMPQIDRPVISPHSMLNGVILLLQGVMKKVLIADKIGSLTGDVWMNPSNYDAAVLFIILPSFIIQIYCDFSGYTDMARGMGRLLGYEIPENFAGPFLSKSIQELWRRWHITLSTWLRDYIYIPLGGSRLGSFRTYFNILFTLALGGFWHGATWNMMLWGIYLGGIMVVERLMKKNSIRILPDHKYFDILRVALT
ncbi:MAG: MBOAT family protein, partial [Spirochaetia bacterium]|nr:MBOAT family protein [Spirochaetia bacterium]